MRSKSYISIILASVTLFFVPATLAIDSGSATISSSIVHADVTDFIYNEVVLGLVRVVCVVLIMATGTLLWLSGLVLNFVVDETILQFVNFANNTGLNTAWEAFRDLANIFLVFVLLTIAIATIIGSTTLGFKQLLARVIIVALLINFSLFFTKLVIDVTNRVAVEFHNSIVVKRGTGISNAVMGTMKLGSFFDFNASNIDAELKKIGQDDVAGVGGIFVFGLFTSIFFIVTAVVFIFASFLLVTRAVVLTILMILSPLAFVARAIPHTQKYFDEWWESLSKHAIFAPMFFMFMWASFQVASSVVREDNNLSFSELFLAENSSAVQLIFSFIIIIGLMVSSIIIAQKLSIKGGGAAVGGLKKTGNFFARRGGAATFGGAAALGRRTIGRRARQYLDSGKGQELEARARSGGFGGALANIRFKATEKTAKGSMDVRGSGLGKGFKKASGIDLGKPKKGGYDAFLKEEKRRDTKAAEAYVASKEIKAKEEGGEFNESDKAQRMEEFIYNRETNQFRGGGLSEVRLKEQREISEAIRESFGKERKDTDRVLDALDKLGDKFDKPN
ncbi:MAG: hypothetical protein QF858_04145 [Candidatus Pacebacteria bacterium]|nr:hypothetical protein [Candidatus Paceibacterota bacterium]